MSHKHIVAYSLIGVGIYDLVFGASTPVPILGDYLNRQSDAILVAAGIAMLLLGKR